MIEGETMQARKLKLIMCEDWFIYMYDPDTKKCYQYNTELMPEWMDLYDEASAEHDAVQKYMYPIVYGQNRGLRDIESIYNPDTHYMHYIGKDI